MFCLLYYNQNNALPHFSSEIVRSSENTRRGERPNQPDTERVRKYCKMSKSTVTSCNKCLDLFLFDISRNDVNSLKSMNGLENVLIIVLVNLYSVSVSIRSCFVLNEKCIFICGSPSFVPNIRYYKLQASRQCCSFGRFDECEPNRKLSC